MPMGSRKTPRGWCIQLWVLNWLKLKHVLHERRSNTPSDKEGTILEELSSGNPYGSVEVLSLHLNPTQICTSEVSGAD